MQWPEPRPEAVDRATLWLNEQDPRLSDDALTQPLREQGYSESEIAAAFDRHRAFVVARYGARTDLRSRAAAILIIGFLLTWLVVSGLLSTATSYWQLAVLVLAIPMGIVLLISLAVVGMSTQLRRGVEGAMVAILTVPFILLFILAGLCVAITGQSSV